MRLLPYLIAAALSVAATATTALEVPTIARASAARPPAVSHTTLTMPAAVGRREALALWATHAPVRLHVWVEAAQEPVDLAIEDTLGVVLASARARVARATALQLDLDAPCEVVIRASARSGAAPLAVALHVRELVRDDDTTVAGARAALARITADSTLDAAIEGIERDEHFECSATLQSALLALVEGAFERAPATPAAAARGLAALERVRALHSPDGTFALRVDRLQAQASTRAGDAARAGALAAAALERLTADPRDDERRLRLDFVDAAATSRYYLGDAARAAELFRDEAEERSDLDGPDAWGTLAVRTSLSSVLFELGRNDEARAEAEEVVVTGTRALGADDGIVLAAETTLASALLANGDVPGALARYEKVVSARLRVFGARDPATQMARVNLGLVLFRAGEKERAIETTSSALDALRERVAGAHPQMQRIEANLAGMLIDVGRAADARPVLERLLAALESSVGPDSALLAATRENLANARAAAGDARGVLALREAAFAAHERSRAPDDPLKLEARSNLAAACFAAGERARAEALATENAVAIVERLRKAALGSTARAVEAAAAGASPALSQVLSLDALSRAPADPARVARGFELVEAARGVGLAALRGSRLVARAGSEARDLERVVRERVSQVARLSASNVGPDELWQAIEAADRARRALAEVLVRDADPALLRPGIDAGSLAARLAPNEAAIGYWIYARGDPRSSTPSEPSVLAHVVRRARALGADCVLERIELGPLAPIEAAIARWREKLADPRATARDERAAAGRALRALLLEPLERSLDGIARVALALDGPLHLVPFDALPDGASVLGERLAIVLRPSFADHVRTLAPLAAEATLLVLGDVDYGTRDDGGAPASTMAALAATKVEIATVAATFERAFGARDRVRTLERGLATRDALLGAAPSARYLHLASHGWIAEDEPEPSQASPFDLGGVRSVRALVPLVRCHLALAGANAQDQGALVTAEELAALDLSRCDLAVLSACNTSAGVAIAGQGIASFQKALLAAGARSAITSLWAVPDRATAELMAAFYAHLWGEGLSKGEALRRAKRDLRARRAPERDWAAWVLAGDDH